MLYVRLLPPNVKVQFYLNMYLLVAYLIQISHYTSAAVAI